MKLSAIERKHLLLAAEELDTLNENSWTEYWMHIDENNKEYPFKLLVRKAYERATGISIDPYFFQSNTGYRRHFEQTFGYKVSFKVRGNIPFFSQPELNYFNAIAGKPYRKVDQADVLTGEQLKNTIYNKTNVWVRALNLEGFMVELDNQWQISGHFKQYSWARLFRPHDRNKKVFFTVGVDANEKALVFKLDCQRKSYNPDKALRLEQQAIFDRIVKPTGADWEQIGTEEIDNYDWERLIDTTKAFIEHYIRLYDEVIAAIWEQQSAITTLQNSLNITPVPKGVLSEIPPPARRTGRANSNPDYDGENKRKKELGDAGERLVINWEREYLKSKGRSDLAEKVCKVFDWQGYDILSYDTDGKQKYIEVKTTTGSEYRPFIFTKNEREIMTTESDKYYLYRLYNFDPDTHSADCFILNGNFSDRVIEEALQFNIYLKQ